MLSLEFPCACGGQPCIDSFFRIKFFRNWTFPFSQPNIGNLKKEYRKAKRKRKVHVETAIKKMPAYDPDAELNGLIYTVGAWNKAIKRTRDNINFNNATRQGKENLTRALKALVIDVCSLNDKLEETEHE